MVILHIHIVNPNKLLKYLITPNDNCYSTICIVYQNVTNLNYLFIY